MRIDLLADHQHLVPTLVRLLHDEWGELEPWRNVARLQARIEGSARRSGMPVTFVAVDDDGALVGSASLKLDELATHPNKRHWLGEAFVRKEDRGRGIGSMLISACILHAESLGIPTLYLYTPDQARLYERFGWEPIDADVVDGEEVRIMRLRLMTGKVFGSGQLGSCTG
jgi:predicted N-acetyltransferase YhbS